MPDARLHRHTSAFAMPADALAEPLTPSTALKRPHISLDADDSLDDSSSDDDRAPAVKRARVSSPLSSVRSSSPVVGHTADEKAADDGVAEGEDVDDETGLSTPPTSARSTLARSSAAERDDVRALLLTARLMQSFRTRRRRAIASRGMPLRLSDCARDRGRRSRATRGCHELVRDGLARAPLVRSRTRRARRTRRRALRRSRAKALRGSDLPGPSLDGSSAVRRWTHRLGGNAAQRRRT